MNERPPVSAAVLATLVASVPPRVSKRLDASPRAADGFTWTFGDEVTIAAGEETVTIASAGVLAPGDARCSCLLAPRCFHLLAVLTVLPIAEGAPPRDEPATAPAAEATATKRTVATPGGGTKSGSAEAPEARDDGDALDPAQRTIAAETARLGATLLADGLSRVSTLRLGELVRVVHVCRREGLYRLESAALGLYESVRDLRAKSGDFRLADAAARLAELLLVAHRLRIGDGARAWRGIGRRVYSPRPALRLAGIACEPVVRRGYAGVVTYLSDGHDVYTAQEVMPGAPDRARDAYDAQVRFGETSLTHREAARGGLLFARAEVSVDGRLGAGREVTCVATAADRALLAPLFSEPLAQQLVRADSGERRGLVFVAGAMHTSDGTIAIATADGAIPLAIPIDDAAFPYRENLERLAGVHARVRLVARIDPAARAPLPVAVALADDEDGFFSLGYDSIPKVRLVANEAPSVPFAAGRSDPAALAPLRRRLLRYALAGEPSLPGAALSEVAREARALREALFPVGATGLEALATTRDPGPAAEVWLALHVYLAAVERSLSRSGWRTH